MDILSLLIISLFIETIVNWIKPIWDKTATKVTTAEIVSMCIGIVIAVFAKINMLASYVTVSEPVLLYLFYILTGIGLGRGPSLLYDLWKKLKAQQIFNQSTVFNQKE